MPIILAQTFPVTSHTDHVGPGSTFVAIKGMAHDGVTFIPLALDKGATTIVVQDNAQISQDIADRIKKSSAKLIKVPDTLMTVAQLSAQEAGHPAKKLRIIGITGTKGKTTSAYLLEHIFSRSGFKTALISTVDKLILGTKIPNKLTTPLPDYLQMFLKTCVEQGVQIVIMEVSAQALSLHRINGINFDGVIFTNFDQEHAEFYPTMESYFEAKKIIFNHLKDGAHILINSDDAWIQKISIKNINFLNFAYNKKADFTLSSFTTGIAGSEGIIEYNDKKFLFTSPLVGLFNGYNILGCASLAYKFGITIDQIVHGLGTFSRVPGRLEQYQLKNGSSAFIDYAHNPSSFNAILSFLNSLTDNLIVVFGAGGNRDHTKRPLMGKIAAQHTNKIILTTDNPRSEKVEDIIKDILNGIDQENASKVHCQLDREKAIKMAYDFSRSGSIIALLGKGPDEYQLINGQKIPFSERKILQSFTK